MNILKLLGLERIVRVILVDYIIETVQKKNGANGFGRALTLPERDVNYVCDRLGIKNADSRKLVLEAFRGIGSSAEATVNVLVEESAINAL